MPNSVRLAVNPNDPEMRYILWTNGRVTPDKTGAHPPPEYDIGDDISGFGSGKQPLVNPNRDAEWVFVAIAIYNWNANPPTGHVMDKYGRVFNLGGAPSIPENTQPFSQTYPNDYYCDFAMDPSGNGQGYAMTRWGGPLTIGGAPSMDDFWFGEPSIQRVYIPDWGTKALVVLTGYGQRLPWNGAIQTIAQKDWYGIGQITNTYQWDEVIFDNIITGARALALYDGIDAGEGHGWELHCEGFILSVGSGTQVPYGELTSPGWPYQMDFAILDNGLGPTPLKFLVLNWQGDTATEIISTPPVVTPTSQPTNPTTNTTRPTVAFAYSDPEGDARQAWQFLVVNSAQYGSSGTNEVQRLTMTGTPTGGSFKLNFQGYWTAAIAYNATAAAVKTALENLPNVEVGDIATSGGPLPGATVDVTFQGGLGKSDVKLMTRSRSLTGGSSPNLTVTTVTAGVPFDPLSVLAPVYSETVTMPDARTRTSFRIKTDLPNDTYRAYARAQDTSGLWSPWAQRQWVQNVVPPPTPTLVASPTDDIGGVQLVADAASVPSDSLYYFEYRDSVNDPWRYVRNGFGVTPTPLTFDATIYDPEPHYGVTRSYRVRQLVSDPWLASAYSTIQTATVNSNRWTLVDPYNPTRGRAVSVREFSMDEEVRRGVFNPDGRPDNVVITSKNAVKYPTFPLKLRTLNRADFDAVRAMITDDGVLLLRNYFGDAYYIWVTDKIHSDMLRAGKTAGETTPLRHAFEMDIPVSVSARPLVGPTSGDLALVD